jgi:hypothetical protein
MQLPRDMAQMNAQELRDLATSLFAQVTQKNQELKTKQLKIDPGALAKISPTLLSRSRPD